MDQKKFYRAIESIASFEFPSEKELLIEVVKQIIKSDQISFTGGRIWKLDYKKKNYKLVFQTGKVQKIPNDFVLAIKDYKLFEMLSKYRTILADETNKTLISKGILKYSASGIGRKIKIGDTRYYEYLLAVNSDRIDEDLRYGLNIVATVLTSKLHEKYVTQLRKNLIDDIDKAKQLQKSILPEHEYDFHDYKIFGITLPADTISGDFYDYLKIGDEEDRLGIILGDAASKGFPAAAEAMYISGALRMASTFQMKISPMMSRLNKLINKIFSDDKFITLFYGELSNDKKGLFLYANAGQNPPVHYSKKSGKLTYLEPTGPLLGPAPNSKYDTDSINFESGDVLLVYSDGIVESANEAFEFYGEEKMEKVFIDNIDKSPKEIATLILEDVIKFTTIDSKYQDDKTVLIVKRK
ncbi:MAG: serine/threonine-protein phosphatase [Melioribacteraceae bacterium]|jgi:sigma-B regulation protein RsbU (phosphoserine phosphatase)|nr:serine/threonine-protein phosphatase [Melioribacteraceae bacterium]